MPHARLPARRTADERRAEVVARALEVFARTGYFATRVSEVADAAGISEAYVYRLYGDKLGLFLAALEHCNQRILAALSAAVKRLEEAGAGSEAESAPAPGDLLAAMAAGYAELIADRYLVALQVHAQSAASVPAIGAAVRRGYATVVTFVQDRSGADDAAVQQFMAYGQLCHLIATTDLGAVQAPWARLLTAGMLHPGGAHA